MAMPAAAVTACCSAMPTSKVRSGNRSWNGSSPVESGIAAVIATTSGRASASLISASVNAAVYEPGFTPAHVVEVLDLVLSRRARSRGPSG